MYIDICTQLYVYVCGNVVYWLSYRRKHVLYQKLENKPSVQHLCKTKADLAALFSQPTVWLVQCILQPLLNSICSQKATLLFQLELKFASHHNTKCMPWNRACAENSSQDNMHMKHVYQSLDNQESLSKTCTSIEFIGAHGPIRDCWTYKHSSGHGTCSQ